MIAFAEKKITYDQFREMEIPDKEYWIADPALQSIEIYALRDGRYKLVELEAGEGVVTSEVLKGLELKMEELFD